MQDIHSIGGGGGRLFSSGGSSGGDRRLRPHHHQSHHHHQALKCPRCDSLNTKFCYYNNYNLSQPRHFCKNCRRYWTKGGVLRNVPVGGGCRKTKRNSKPKPEQTRSSPPQQQQILIERKSTTNSHNSSSESSSLTVTNHTNVESVSVHSSSSLMNHPGFETGSGGCNLLEQGSDCGGIFSEIGSFTNLITSSHEPMNFGFSNLMNGLDQSTEQWQQQKVGGGGNQELKMEEMNIDHQIELSSLQDRSGGGFGSLDWQGSSDDQGMFDLPNASYWNQSTQWTDHQDHPSLYLP